MLLLLACLFCHTAMQNPQVSATELLFRHSRHITAETCMHRNGTDWDGHDIYPNQPIENLESAEDCCNRCKEIDECVAYVFNLDFHFCWPKSDIGLPIQCPNCQSENFNEQVPPMACNAEYGTDRLGSDLLDSPLENITQPGDCCQECQETPDCISYVWRRDFNRCWLKSRRQTTEPCATCVSGDLD